MLGIIFRMCLLRQQGAILFLLFQCRGSGPDSTVTVTFALRFLAGETVATRHDFPLPDPPASVAAAGGFNYPNSNGFQYEADAIYKCIREGQISCDLYTTSEMMAVRSSISRRLAVWLMVA